MPMGMYSRCKQKYSYKRLLALHPTEKRTYPDSFKFPSCCSCHIKYLDEYLGRSNFRKLENKVDISEQTGRDSRAMSNTSNRTSFIQGSPSSLLVSNDNNSTIEIMSQSHQALVVEIVESSTKTSSNTATSALTGTATVAANSPSSPS